MVYRIINEIINEKTDIIIAMVERIRIYLLNFCCDLSALACANMLTISI